MNTNSLTPQEVLNAAADYLEEHGWRNDGKIGDDGECCAVNAMKEVAGGLNSSYDAAWCLFKNFLKIPKTISEWNDEQPDATTVIKALREAAK